MTLRPKTVSELDIMREGGKILNATLEATHRFLVPGKTLKDVDHFIANFIVEHEAKPSFLGYHGFPAASCLSLNAAVVHGIPSDYRLKDGDVLGIDVGVLLDGYHTDAAFTQIIGKAVSNSETKLLTVTQTALKIGIEAALAGNLVQDIGRAIEAHVKKQGTYGIIRDLSGHGIGQKLQEAPEILNYFHHNTSPLINNLTLAIEPMISLGGWEVEIEADNWTVVTRDRSRAAHFETTVIVHENDPEILVSFPLDVTVS